MATTKERLLSFAIDGYRPFGGDANDCALSILNDVQGLAIALESAFSASDESKSESPFDTMRPVFLARAMGAMAKLNALAILVLKEEA